MNVSGGFSSPASTASENNTNKYMKSDWWCADARAIPSSRRFFLEADDFELGYVFEAIVENVMKQNNIANLCGVYRDCEQLFCSRLTVGRRP